MSFYDAWDEQKPRTSGTATVHPLRPATDPGTRYALKALEAECERVANAQPGQRDHTINAAAHAMGQLVGAGVLDQATAIGALWDAARRTGQPEDDIARALRHGTDRNASTGGFETGRRNPRINLPDETQPAPAPPVTVLDDSTPTPAPSPVTVLRERLPILDWHEVWAHDDGDEEWIVEPLLPARRMIALYSPPKVGKSLLMLELAVAIAQGGQALGTAIPKARRVLYVDFENDPYGDIRSRLIDMGQTPDRLGNLCYLSFPTMAHLDTAAGADELLGAADAYDCEVIVIDTVSRAVGGEENENDTWLAFYRHTGLRVKQARKALIRLDHAGKDEGKGMRGGSAKYGDVDAVWKMSRITDTTYKLHCEAHRFPLAEETLVLHRKTEPLRHSVDALGGIAAARAREEEWGRALDEARAGREISVADAAAIVRAAGLKATTAPFATFVKRRREMWLPTVSVPLETEDEIARIDVSPKRLRNEDA